MAKRWYVESCVSMGEPQEETVRDDFVVLLYSVILYTVYTIITRYYDYNYTVIHLNRPLVWTYWSICSTNRIHQYEGSIYRPREITRYSSVLAVLLIYGSVRPPLTPWKTAQRHWPLMWRWAAKTGEEKGGFWGGRVSGALGGVAFGFFWILYNMFK